MIGDSLTLLPLVIADRPLSYRFRERVAVTECVKRSTFLCMLKVSGC